MRAVTLPSMAEGEYMSTYFPRHAYICKKKKKKKIKEKKNPPHVTNARDISGDRAALLMWHAAEMTVTMVCIGVPVCRPLWKQWVNKLVSGDRTQHTSEQYFGQQRYSIGGSDMWASEGKDSKPRSRPRKWSDAPKGWSEPSDSNAAVNKIQPIKLVPLEAIKSESTASANGMHSPDSWSTWNPSNNK